METQQTRSWKETKYFYKGIPFEERVSPRVRVEAVGGYKDIRNDDVIVCTYPKAGTHWAANIAKEVLCNGDLDQARRLTEAYFEISPPPGVNKGDRAYMPRSLDEITELPSPRVIQTHMQFSMLPTAVYEKKTKVIYVYRNPRDIAVSSYHWIKRDAEVRGIDFDVSWPDFLDHFGKGELPFGFWQNHYKDFQENSHRTNCLVLKYEEMHRDLSAAVRSVAEFLGKKLTDDIVEKITESCRFDSMKKSHHLTALFRKGTTGDWKNAFTVTQSDLMTEIIRRAKEEMGLTIDYE